MDIKIAGSNPAEVLLGVDESTGAVLYSTDGDEWKATKGSGSTGPDVDDILNAVGNYEEQLAQI